MKNPFPFGIVSKMADGKELKITSLNEYTSNCINIHILLAFHPK